MHLFSSILFLLFLTTTIYALLPPRCVKLSLFNSYLYMATAGTLYPVSFNVEACIDSCKNMNYPFAVTYQSNCFCLPSTIFPLIAPDIECNISCAANASDLLNSAFCGGGAGILRYMSLYEPVKTPRYLGIKVTPSSGFAYDWTQVYFISFECF